MRWIVVGLCTLLAGAAVAWVWLTITDIEKETADAAHSSKGVAYRVEGKPGKKPSGTKDARSFGNADKFDNPASGGTGGGGEPVGSSGGFGIYAPDDDYEKGEVIALDPPKRFSSVASRLGFSITEVARLEELSLDLYRLRVPLGMSVPEARKLLRGRFPGMIIDANHNFHAQGVEDYQGSLPRAVIGWRKATPECGAGVRLGMIDAPVDLKHPALSGQRIVYRSFHKKERRPGPADHGTAIASMLVGKPKWGGLLPGAELMAANMFEFTESGRLVGSGMGLVKAINWMAQKQVQIINLSVAGANNKVVRSAVDKARKKGLIMIAAAGNWGKKGNKPAYPAAYKDVVAVTAFGAGKIIYSKANTGDYIDFAAPGVKVYTAVPGGGRVQSGTSFATPYVSVLLALEIERGTSRRSSTLRKSMRGHTIDLGITGKDKVYGWGFVNLQPRCG